ncbi:hypothetical protein GCM10010425_38450 [Streptomyces spororaveus]|uniref:Uncharacterized protein n=1 Tax=Streptomyces spororaveus TaxID=284039 RepID=A0ABQ3TPN8_9ACTN|nr:hypothetical protein Sspor_79360 [Streptomyces spororaveus]
MSSAIAIAVRPIHSDAVTAALPSGASVLVDTGTTLSAEQEEPNRMCSISTQTSGHAGLNRAFADDPNRAGDVAPQMFDELPDRPTREGLATSAPARPSPIAVALPMPEFAPVTSAFWPRRIAGTGRRSSSTAELTDLARRRP